MQYILVIIGVIELLISERLFNARFEVMTDAEPIIYLLSICKNEDIKVPMVRKPDPVDSSF